MEVLELIDKFKNREVKAREVFVIEEISKMEAYNFVRTYHYLGDAKFFSIYSFGLFMKDKHILVGVATFSLPQGTDALKGWFGIDDNSTNNILELSRLCMLPILNGSNATSFLLSNSIKKLKLYNVRAVITLADASRHIGSIYQVCNFKYYGMTKSAKDFYTPDGKVNPRGTPSQWDGVYLPRTRKHRYAFILDETLKCLYQEEQRPSDKNNTLKADCCEDLFIVYDNRFNKWWTCPKCTSKMVNLTIDEVNLIKDKAQTLSREDLLKFVENIIASKEDKEESLW